MPTGRAALLLRRLSSGDSRLKNLNVNQNSPKEVYYISNPNCIHTYRDFTWRIRVSPFSTYLHKPPLSPQFPRGLSDNIIKMFHSSSIDKNSSCSGDTCTPKETTFTNRLAKEKSPYLLQHAHNPVDWYPWCQEAFDRAKKENKLIFLSIGYSTCHWCHVMERESFENIIIARIMNEKFINIKVDREERPDVDRLYMLFLMARTGSGGWPMTIFLTPDLIPINGGTYFPPEDLWGHPGLKTILQAMARKWKEESSALIGIGDKVMEHLKKAIKLDVVSSTSIPGESIWKKCVQKYILRFEPEFGGFSGPPKFPHVSAFNFLFHYYARDKYDATGKKCLQMCLHSLTKMADGGIHDHVGGGFARYSTDNVWHIPHFEKMLYDQSQLVIVYTDAYLATKDQYFADVVHDILNYVNRDLRHNCGGYFSAEDADSYPYIGAAHKLEGAFYVWEYDELKDLLGKKMIRYKSYLDIFCDYFNVEVSGNTSTETDVEVALHYKNVLIIYGTKEDIMEKYDLTYEEFTNVISECLELLYEKRQERPRPHLDTKMVCSWNGLMIAGLARAGQGLENKSYVEDAIKTANFVKEHLYDPNTLMLFRSCYKEEDGHVTRGDHPINGFLEDYAFLIKGLLDLYEASLDMQWLNWAQELQKKQDELFWDDVNGGYFTTSGIDKTMILRLKQDQDSAEPSGNSVSGHNLLRLAAYRDRSLAPEGGANEREKAKKLLLAFAEELSETPHLLPEMMSALMMYHDSPTQVLISGKGSDPRTLELIRVVRSRLLPGRVLALADPTNASDSPLIVSRVRSCGDVPSASVCRRFTCSLPVTDARQLENLLDDLPPGQTDK
ncbi:spermatogenesis-associated protein 20 isoform X1 [Leptidea sinapis]|uniref:spermatogenesis-associated protein 20 isoform X1 n=2 Tax=Leptidea sinapis TaxID=189913 RepID=UPI0021C49327|nr:spermatogenesis-associated protein 20 isoform X1 [Leptidea sinapis]